MKIARCLIADRGPIGDLAKRTTDRPSRVQLVQPETFSTGRQSECERQRQHGQRRHDNKWPCGLAVRWPVVPKAFPEFEIVVVHKRPVRNPLLIPAHRRPPARATRFESFRRMAPISLPRYHSKTCLLAIRPLRREK